MWINGTKMLVEKFSEFFGVPLALRFLKDSHDLESIIVPTIKVLLQPEEIDKLTSWTKH